MAIYAVPIISESGKSFVDIDILTDGAGNLLLGIVGAGNENGVDCYKLSTSGVLTYLDTVLPGPGGTEGHKVDKAAIHRSGANLVVGMITHDAVSADPRSIRVELAQVPNVYVVRPGEELEEGGAGAFQPTGGTEVEIDYDRIASIVADKVNAAQTLIINNMLSKAKAALTQEGVLTLGNVYTSDGLYQRFKDTTKEECTKALVDYRVAREPQP